jgi:hypothetical protein
MITLVVRAGEHPHATLVRLRRAGPESHSRHHERGVHAGHYADLPIFDIVFGTFNNPREFAPAVRSCDGAFYRVGEMLRRMDVSMPREADGYARRRYEGRRDAHLALDLGDSCGMSSWPRAA